MGDWKDDELYDDEEFVGRGPKPAMTDAKGLSEQEEVIYVKATKKWERVGDVVNERNALAERLKFMESERDRLRDTKWEGIVELEERLKACEEERDNLRLRIRAVDEEHEEVKREKHKVGKAIEAIEDERQKAFARGFKEGESKQAILEIQAQERFMKSIKAERGKLTADLDRARADVERLKQRGGYATEQQQ